MDDYLPFERPGQPRIRAALELAFYEAELARRIEEVERLGADDPTLVDRLIRQIVADHQKQHLVAISMEGNR